MLAELRCECPGSGCNPFACLIDCFRAERLSIGLRVSPTIYPPQHKAPVKRLLQTLGLAMSFLLAMASFFLFFVFGIQWHPNWLSEDVALHRRGDCHCGCDQLWSLDLESKTRQKTEEMSVLGYFGFILYILFKGTTDHCNPRCKLPWIYQYDQVIRDFVDIWYHFEHWGNHQEYWNEKQKNLSKIYQYISMYIYDDIFIYIYLENLAPKIFGAIRKHKK